MSTTFCDMLTVPIENSFDRDKQRLRTHVSLGLVIAGSSINHGVLAHVVLRLSRMNRFLNLLARSQRMSVAISAARRRCFPPSRIDGFHMFCNLDMVVVNPELAVPTDIAPFRAKVEDRSRLSLDM